MFIKVFLPLLLGSVSTLSVIIPVRAAEEIKFSYGLLDFDLSVASLETYAREGKIEPDLAFYFQFLSPEGETQIRDALQFSRQMSAWEVSQLLYAPMGESALRNLGFLIQTESRQNGFYAMRGAIIQATADSEGLSLLGVLRHFPVQSIRMNVPLALELVNHIAEFADTTETVIGEIQTQSEAAATEEPIDLKKLPLLQDAGSFQVSKQTLMLRDDQRNRNIPTDLYLPVLDGVMPESIPVVVYSHGYGETRATAAPFLELLTSYGFIVAAPEHIGSNYQFQQDLLRGLTHESFAASEFADRPLDVSYVLDILEQKNAPEFGNRLNLQRVGAFGHSFGGYTVLALGGATVDFDQLQNKCQQDFLLQSLDNALLLQCRVLELKSSPQSVELLTSGALKDQRIQSVVAVTPVGGAIFGQQGVSQIDVPVLLFGGGHDPVTPLVPEQVQAFTGLTTEEKYLLISNNAAHSATITELVNRILLPADLDTQVTEDMSVFLSHLRNVGVAFMQVYVAERLEYRPYLQSSYVESLDLPVFNFSLIRSFSSEQLEHQEN